jgi:hypothetical protein
MTAVRCTSSFRDPCGFVFHRDGNLFRQVNVAYQEHYEHLIQSGLYEELTTDGLLIPHEEVPTEPLHPIASYRVLRPDRVPFVSYPYEWTFSQLRGAALLTLEIQERALRAGMTLKDASAYNVQFRGARPVFIDTLSFEVYRPGEPWQAYRQFCQHFLAPLALMSRCDVRLGQLQRTNLDGIPLDLAARLLPTRSRLNLGLLLHIAIHARFQASHADGPSKPPRRGFSKRSMQGLVDSLRAVITALRWSPPPTEWSAYSECNTYTDTARNHKQQLVAEFLDVMRPSLLWDLGANIGEYSRIAVNRGISTVAFDGDPSCVEHCYLQSTRRGESLLLPLLADLVNPSAGIGWHCRERPSLLERGPADGVLALALIHHLAIGNNLPFDDIARFFHDAGRWLIVEFVPKDDSQVQRLLRNRQDIFPAYRQDAFESAFQRHFTIRRSEPVRDSGRSLYLMQRKDDI